MKYYYTDPLAAAWQAKHFGMRFADDTGSVKHIDGATVALLEGLGMGCRPYYIHPDSLRILTPQVGDLVEGIRIGTVFEVNGNELSVDVHGGDWEMDADRVTILRRDGKPFHTPEREPA